MSSPYIPQEFPGLIRVRENGFEVPGSSPQLSVQIAPLVIVGWAFKEEVRNRLRDICSTSPPAVGATLRR